MHAYGCRSAIAAILLVCSPKPGLAQDLGPLTGIVTPENDGVWTVEAAPDGGALLSNPEGAYEIKYFYLNPLKGEEGAREVSVDIEMIEHDADSLAGILYGYEGDPLSYFIFAVGGDGQVHLYYRGEDGFNEMMAVGSDDLRLENTRLTLREYGGEIGLSINGAERSRIGNDRIGRGGVGIVAAHIGAFRFSNFTAGVAAAPEMKGEKKQAKP